MAGFIVANIAVGLFHNRIGHGGSSRRGSRCGGSNWGWGCGWSRCCGLGRERRWHGSLYSLGGRLRCCLRHGRCDTGCGRLNRCGHCGLCKRSSRSGNQGGSNEGIFDHDFLINEAKAPHSINVTGLLSVDFKIHKGKQVLACQPPCCHLTGWRLGLLMDTSY